MSVPSRQTSAVFETIRVSPSTAALDRSAWMKATRLDKKTSVKMIPTVIQSGLADATMSVK